MLCLHSIGCCSIQYLLQSDFIPTTEFLKSEIGILIERNFPAGMTDILLENKYGDRTDMMDLL